MKQNLLNVFESFTEKIIDDKINNKDAYKKDLIDESTMLDPREFIDEIEKYVKENFADVVDEIFRYDQHHVLYINIKGGKAKPNTDRLGCHTINVHFDLHDEGAFVHDNYKHTINRFDAQMDFPTIHSSPNVYQVPIPWRFTTSRKACGEMKSAFDDRDKWYLHNYASLEDLKYWIKSMINMYFKKDDAIKESFTDKVIDKAKGVDHQKHHKEEITRSVSITPISKDNFKKQLLDFIKNHPVFKVSDRSVQSSKGEVYLNGFGDVYIRMYDYIEYDKKENMPFIKTVDKYVKGAIFCIQMYDKGLVTNFETIYRVNGENSIKYRGPFPFFENSIVEKYDNDDWRSGKSKFNIFQNTIIGDIIEFKSNQDILYAEIKYTQQLLDEIKKFIDYLPTIYNKLFHKLKSKNFKPENILKFLKNEVKKYNQNYVKIEGTNVFPYKFANIDVDSIFKMNESFTSNVIDKTKSKTQYDKRTELSYIKFEDPEVERICHEHNVYTYGDAAKVTSIDNWFDKAEDRNFKSFRELKYFTTLENITRFSFAKCELLQYIELPHSLKSIEFYAFDNCDSLESIEIPNSVTIIKYGAFAQCESLKSVNIPEGLKQIESFTFSFCFSLRSIKIPEGVTYIGESVFENCESLVDVNIPTSVTKIKKNIFDGCGALKSIKISRNCPVYKQIKKDYPYLTLVEPSVSESFTSNVIDKKKSVDKKKYTEDVFGYVDLGLPSGNLWAIKNAGAETPDDLGDFYTGVEAKDMFDDKNDGHLPSLEDYEELIEFTTGYLEKDRLLLKSFDNNRSISFPVTGYYEVRNDIFEDGHDNGTYYWTSTPYRKSTDITKVFYFSVIKNIYKMSENSNFKYKMSVRLVKSGNKNKNKITESFTTDVIKTKKDISSSKEEIRSCLYNFIDLGLPSGNLWSIRNVGANLPDEFGNYFTYDEAIKIDDNNEGILPSYSDYQELIDYTTKSYRKVNGVKGITFTGSNNKSIFFPECGLYTVSKEYRPERPGMYWTSTRRDKDSTRSWLIEADSEKQQFAFFNGPNGLGLSARLIKHRKNEELEESFTSNVIDKTKSMSQEGKRANIVPIVFEDPEVERICHEHGIYSYEDAKNPSKFENFDYTWFRDSKIRKFNEFKYFTGITKLPTSTFDWCNKLEELTLPESLKEIGMWAFNFCGKLKSLYIPSSCEYLQRDPFSEMRSLSDLYIPSTLHLKKMNDVMYGEDTFRDLIIHINTDHPDYKRVCRWAKSKNINIKNDYGVFNESFTSDVINNKRDLSQDDKSKRMIAVDDYTRVKEFAKSWAENIQKALKNVKFDYKEDDFDGMFNVYVGYIEDKSKSNNICLGFFIIAKDYGHTYFFAGYNNDEDSRTFSYDVESILKNQGKGIYPIENNPDEFFTFMKSDAFTEFISSGYSWPYYITRHTLRLNYIIIDDFEYNNKDFVLVDKAFKKMKQCLVDYE